MAGSEGKVAPELLAGNLFGLGTGGGVLAMEPESRKVMYSYQCGLTELSHERFLDIMDSAMRPGGILGQSFGETQPGGRGNRGARPRRNAVSGVTGRFRMQTGPPQQSG